MFNRGFKINRSEHLSSLVPLLSELKGEASWLESCGEIWLEIGHEKI